jgi:DNA-binding transcriptional ArsR family regulator
MSISATLTAVAHPTRRAVVDQLAGGTATVSELAASHAMSLPAFTKHMGVLVDAGLVSRRKLGRSVLCTLEPQPLTEVADWVTDLTKFWSGALDRLDLVTREDS